MVPDLQDNSLGRAYCLWLMARELGWHADVLSTRGSTLWAPLRGTEFADDCRLVAEAELSRELGATRADVIVAVKAHPESFGLAETAASQLGVPLVLDYDDPDIEAVLSWKRFIRRIARAALRPKQVRQYQQLASRAKLAPKIVSNPALARRWGGVVIPHVRPLPPAQPSSKPQGGALRLVFVGTNRRHKGVPELRRAVKRLQVDGWTLTITSPPPSDAAPWEHWVGYTSFEQGQRIIADADVVAIPSRRSVFSAGQLPAKLIDAMVAGKAVVASDLEPIRWAAGDSAAYMRPGSTRDLIRQLRVLTSQEVRSNLGKRAREVAGLRFTVEGNAVLFEQVCRGAMAAARTGE